MAFNAKNLAYESKAPAFLRRLQAEVGGNTVDRPNPRPRKAPREDDEDDEPTYVLEGNETITSEEFRAMNEGTDKDSSKEEQNSCAVDKSKGNGDKNATDITSSKEKKGNEGTVEIGIGNQKKRKAAKIIGDQEDENTTSAKDSKSKVESSSSSKGGNSNTTGSKKTKKQKKSAVKLSFGDEGE